MDDIEDDFTCAPLNSSIVVTVRIKPIEDNDENIVIIPGDDPQMINVKRLHDMKTFHFDFVHWSTGTSNDIPSYATNEQIYKDIGLPVIDNIVEGYNCSVFAYGQTVIRLLRFLQCYIT